MLRFDKAIYLSLLFKFILSVRLSAFSPCFFLRCIQSNLEYLIQNMIHHVVQTLHPMSELIF